MSSTTSAIPSEILSANQKSIEARNVIIELWTHRHEPLYVSRIVDTLSHFIDEKKVFNDIEFYLPQFAHMVIHLDETWNNKILERLAVLLAQASIHTALQLSFILIAAMEDVQPEFSNGVANPQRNPLLFFRCARLLQTIERAVVFGKLEVTDASATDSSVGHIDILHPNSKKQVDKIVDVMDAPTSTTGVLLYKRIERKGFLYSKGWKPRHVVIENRVLYIYHDEHAPMPLRAFPLQGCMIITPDDAKYPYYFELINASTKTKYLLRAQDGASFTHWTTAIKNETDEPPQDVTEVKEETTADGTGDESRGQSLKQTLHAHAADMDKRVETMTVLQKKRFETHHHAINLIKFP